MIATAFDSAVSIVSASAAFLQALFVVVSIVYLNRQFAIVRACSYIERFNSHENIRRRGTVDRWLRSANEDATRIQSFEKDPELQADVLGFINLFQELGVAFFHHSVHKNTVSETFDFLVPWYWKQINFLVKHLRTQRRSPTLYRKFQLMADELSQQDSVESEQIIPTNALRPSVDSHSPEILKKSENVPTNAA